VEQRAGAYQSLSWGSAALGGIVSAYFSGSLIEKYGVSFVFSITGFFPLLVVASALLIQEKRVSHPALGPPHKLLEDDGVQLQNASLKDDVMAQV
jgi:hypothetical protein